MGGGTRKRRSSTTPSAPALVAAATSLRRTLPHRLLPLAPLFLFSIALLVFIATRTNFSSPSPLSHELSQRPPRYTIDSDLLSSNRHPNLSDLRDAVVVHDGLYLSATATGLGEVQLHLTTPFSSSVDTSNQLIQVPRLVDLARALSLSHCALPGWETRLPLVLTADIARRDAARAVLSACGFRSRSKVPPGAVLTARVVAVPHRMKRMELLHMPAVEPYEWQAVLPSAAACGDADDTNGVRERCRRVVEVMLLAYVGGCSPPGSGDLFEEGGRSGGLAIGVPKACFSQGRQAAVTFDLFVRYVSEVCELPTGLVARLRSLRAISWGVGKRVWKVLQVLEGTDGRAGACDKNAWVFYDGRG